MPKDSASERCARSVKTIGTNRLQDRRAGAVQRSVAGGQADGAQRFRASARVARSRSMTTVERPSGRGRPRPGSGAAAGTARVSLDGQVRTFTRAARLAKASGVCSRTSGFSEPRKAYGGLAVRSPNAQRGLRGGLGPHRPGASARTRLLVLLSSLPAHGHFRREPRCGAPRPKAAVSMTSTKPFPPGVTGMAPEGASA